MIVLVLCTFYITQIIITSLSHNIYTQIYIYIMYEYLMLYLKKYYYIMPEKC